MNISQILTKLKSLVYSKSEADTLLSSKASSSHKHTKSEITDFPTIPTKTSQLSNDSGYLTSEDIRVINEAEDSVFVCIGFGGNQVVIPKGDIQYIVTSEVKDV